MADFNQEQFDFPATPLNELVGSDAAMEHFGFPAIPLTELVVYAAAGAVAYYTNRVYDTVAAGFVRWTTTPLPDPTGASYPGPGTFGVDTSDYCVERAFEA